MWPRTHDHAPDQPLAVRAVAALVDRHEVLHLADAVRR